MKLWCAKYIVLEDKNKFGGKTWRFTKHLNMLLNCGQLNFIPYIRSIFTPSMPIKQVMF